MQNTLTFHLQDQDARRYNSSDELGSRLAQFVESQPEEAKVGLRNTLDLSPSGLAHQAYNFFEAHRSKGRKAVS